VERTGIEPVTSGLQSRASEDYGRLLATTNGRNHAGFTMSRYGDAAWLVTPFSDVLGHEWGTSDDVQPYDDTPATIVKQTRSGPFAKRATQSERRRTGAAYLR
jgi:hypothetical protein